VSVEPGFYDYVAAADPNHILAHKWGTGFRLFSVPELRWTDEVRIAVGGQTDGGFGRALLPEPNGWIYVSSDGHVVRLRAHPFQLVSTGRASLSSVRGATIDPTSGHLILTGDGKYAELFDANRMVTMRRWDVGVKTIQGVCVGGDAAWIATDDGAFVKFVLTTNQVTQRIRVVEEDDDAPVRLDLSLSGKLLAAAGTHRVSRGRFAAHLQLFRVESGRIELAASARATVGSMIDDLTIVESHHMVVLASQRPTLAWKYGAIE
jgi:hypothetical protein